MTEIPKIRLLFLLPSYTFGGAERTSLNLLRGIDTARFRICLVTSKLIFRRFQHIGIEDFFPIEDLGINTWFGTLGSLLHDVRRVAVLLRQKTPDLAFGMMHYPSSLLVFAKKLFQCPVKIITSPRGPSTEYLKYFEKELFRKTYLKVLFRFFYKYTDGLIVASQGMKRESVQYFHADPDRITVIANSVDSLELKEKAEENIDIEIPAGYRIICTSGRLEREKNLTFLLRVFSLLRKTERVKLIIIGDGTERKNLEKLSRELNIGEDVIFVGYQTNPYKFIKRSDIYVHTCLFEGFANSIIEAMACGIPVVATDCPYGPRDIISDGINGFLIPMNNEITMVDVLLTLMHNEEIRRHIGEKGAARIKDFSVEKMVNGYEKIFTKIAQKT